MLKTVFSVCLVLLMSLTACQSQLPSPLQIQAVEAMPPLAAEFETEVLETDTHGDETTRVYRWRFVRHADRVETHNLSDDSGEVWRRLAGGDIAYQKVFHGQRQTIDYQPGDLKALAAVPDWRAVATLLSPTELGGLQADGEESALGRVALRYRSGQGEIEELLWLNREQLPALIRRQEHGHLLVTRLAALYPTGQAPWPEPRDEDYGHTDYADLGDKEGDPFVKSILPTLKGGHHHEH